MAWLVSDARVLASAELAADRSSRRRGLLGRDALDGALVIDGCRWIHTIGMRFPIDVAYLDEDGVVIKTNQMARHRLGLPVWRARSVIEAQAGAFERWGLCLGDGIEVRTDDEPGRPGTRTERHGDGTDTLLDRPNAADREPTDPRSLGDPRHLDEQRLDRSRLALAATGSA